MGWAVTSWLVLPTPDRAVQVGALAGGVGGGTLCCVLGQDTLLSQPLSPPRCINGYRRFQCWGITLRLISTPETGIIDCVTNYCNERCYV